MALDLKDEREKLNEKIIELREKKQEQVERLNKETEKEIERIKKEIEEISIKKDEAYRCKNCGKFVWRSDLIPGEHQEEGLCRDCWEKREREKSRQRLLGLYKDARIVDIEPYIESYSFSSHKKALSVVIETSDKQRYELRPNQFEDKFIWFFELSGE